MALQTLIDGLCFAEGPRWHDGRLWFSDMHAPWVMTVDEAGRTDRIVEVPTQPSGLGWRPDGTLLIVSMTDRKLLQYKDGDLSPVADMYDLAPWHCNDMVVDAKGRAYIGNFGFDLFAPDIDLSPEGLAKLPRTNLLLVDTDGHVREVAGDLGFPNGMVITPDDKTLIVAETLSRCLTAFDIKTDGSLSGRRVWAAFDDAAPDGICLDEAGGIWIASPMTQSFLRVEEGGRITHRLEADRQAIACALGGTSGKTLFALTAETTHPDQSKELKSARIETAEAPYAHAGRP